jgi:hypothetical protein
MKNKLYIQSLAFLNSKLDEIIGKTDLINELMDDEEDPKILVKLEEKLSLLEKEVEHIGNKIRIEQEMLKKVK